MIYFLHIVVCFSMVVFHTTLAPYSSIFSGVYDLLVIFVIYLGFFRKAREGIPFVLFFGITMDAFTGGILGLYVTTYFWLYICVVGLTLFMRTNNIMLLPAVALFGVVFENAVLIGVTTLLDPDSTMPASAFRIVAVQAAWAFFTGPVLIIMLKYVDDRWEKFLNSRQKEYA